MRYDEYFNELCGAMEGAGAFLVVEDAKGRVNTMTIGWAQLGVIWGEPIMSVLVRPSRHTYSLLETAAHFCVCVPRPGELKKELAFCGSKSGREYDKIRACGLKLKDGAGKGLKYIDGCALVYQCALYGRAALPRGGLAPEALKKYYGPAETPHTLYFGKVIKAEHFK
ncbi:MAG: flavin reductase family protein [Elusimicrobiales bacterium]